MLQQCLPLAVLKLTMNEELMYTNSLVATVLTACGIETQVQIHRLAAALLVATVLTACGIETVRNTNFFVGCF